MIEIRSADGTGWLTLWKNAKGEILVQVKDDGGDARIALDLAGSTVLRAWLRDPVEVEAILKKATS